MNNLIISKETIASALAFYNIKDKEYESKCYECLESIQNSKGLIGKFNEIYETIYLKDLDRANVKKLLNVQNTQELFGKGCHPFVTNLLLLSGYLIHSENINMLDDEQKQIHLARVKDSLTIDVIQKNLPGIRISQMLWGAYFQKLKIIQVGRLQYELCRYNPIDESIKEDCVKIHIPAGNKLDICQVKQSLKDSKIAIKKYFGIDNFNYYCNSWLLSKELHEVLDKNSNIYKFYELFDVVTPGSDAVSDILNFVFGSRDLNDYTVLPEDTSLQKKLKQMLLRGANISLGIGKLK